MIFVTVGVSKYQFVRLLKAMDEIAGELDEEVIFQAGSGGYWPKNGLVYEAVSRSMFNELVSKARVVVGAGGVGTTLVAVKYDRPIIIFSRVGSLGEHMGDQGLEFAEAASSENIAYVANTKEELKTLLTRDELKGPSAVSRQRMLVEYLSQFLAQSHGGEGVERRVR